MDLTSIETNKHIIWDESIEKILSELGDEAQINAFLHKHSQIYYTRENIKYQLPIIVLSALSGTGNFISSNFPEYADTIILGIGGISIFTSILSSEKFLLAISIPLFYMPTQKIILVSSASAFNTKSRDATILSAFDLSANPETEPLTNIFSFWPADMP